MTEREKAAALASEGDDAAVDVTEFVAAADVAAAVAELGERCRHLEVSAYANGDDVREAFRATIAAGFERAHERMRQASWLSSASEIDNKDNKDNKSISDINNEENKSKANLSFDELEVNSDTTDDELLDNVVSDIARQSLSSSLPPNVFQSLLDEDGSANNASDNSTDGSRKLAMSW